MACTPDCGPRGEDEMRVVREPVHVASSEAAPVDPFRAAPSVPPAAESTRDASRMVCAYIRIVFNGTL